jgi:hypothetical protein
MDGLVARMSNADRLRSGHGLPTSDILVDIGPVDQHAPSTSSQRRPSHPGQWIRSDTRRYTQQGTAFLNSNSVPPIAPASPTSKPNCVHTSIMRTLRVRHRLQKTRSTGPAHHIAPHRASGRSCPPPTSIKPRSQPTLSCAANTRNPPRPRLSTPRPTRIPPHHTTNPTWSICPQTLTSRPRTYMCCCGIGARMSTPRTTTTPGAVLRDIHSLRSSLCPNHPQPPKTWALHWNLHLAEDSRRSSPRRPQVNH